MKSRDGKMRWFPHEIKTYRFHQMEKCVRYHMKQEKPQGALTPPLFSLPLGSKIYYGQVKVVDLSYLLRACDDNINQDTTCLITLF